MKRLLGVLLTVFLLAGCGREPAVSGVKPVVYASFYPVWDLAAKAAGDLAEVRCLIPPGAEPHDWEPTPREIIALKEARLFLYSGLGLEDWLAGDILPELEAPAVATAETAGITPLEGDPHVWLSPKNAKLQFLAAAEALKQALPEQARAISENEARWLKEFDKLDEEFRELESLPKKAIVVTHSAFAYLCGEYGLLQISPVGYSPNVEADPAAIARVVTQVRERGLPVIFYDKPENMQLAEAIAAETGAKTYYLNPLEGVTEEALKAGGDYFSAMRENLAALKEALG